MMHAFVDIGDKTMCSRCGNEVLRVDEVCPSVSDGEMYKRHPQAPPITQADVKALASAMWQLLDDIGNFACMPCRAAIAQARVAYEPFHDLENDGPMDVSIERAKAILIEATG